MDYRLALLLHYPLGLPIERQDGERLWNTNLDRENKTAVVASLISPMARDYLRRHPQWETDAAAILNLCSQRGIRWSYLGQSDYPTAWYYLAKPPLVFSYHGEPCWLNSPFVSVVGSRTPATDTLLWMQRELSEFLRCRQVGVVSGGARGVDQWAHRLAMDSNRPTICVLPTGLLNPYPFGHEEFWQKIIAKGGCLVSTCALTEPLHKSYFHIRNRWIAGLSPICFVAEANRRSGSQLTARLALEEGKTLCTLPVFPLAHQGLGNLDLLEQGAFMLRDHRDLVTLWDREGRNHI